MIGKIKFWRMEQAELFQEMLEIMTSSYFERREKFKDDGSYTDKCKWGYGVVIDTGLCIALEQCRKEFNKEK